MAFRSRHSTFQRLSRTGEERLRGSILADRENRLELATSGQRMVAHSEVSQICKYLLAAFHGVQLTSATGVSFL
jgi:hypothetical protein